MSFRTVASRILVAIFALSLAGAAHAQAPGAAAEKQSVVVHLTDYSGDLHAVAMAFTVASGLMKAGAQVTVFLDLEGVRLADTRVPQDLRWGHGDPVSAQFDAFVAAGGTFLVCDHCARAAGLDAAHLRKGATIATGDALPQLLLRADKILDY
jgi:predicted peroxiredoxin